VIAAPRPASKPGLLDHLQPESSQFAHDCVAAIQRFGRTISQASAIDERWSLTECGLREPDWEKIRYWARLCPAAGVPKANGRAAGVMLLAVSTAVARSLEKDEALWHSVADACSPALQRELFGNSDYPVGEARDALSEACHTLGLRHQLNLPGKHRFWRTVLLQFGFSAKVGAARLPFWLAGYNVPDTIRALLTEGDENSSHYFQELWRELERWNRRSGEVGLEERLHKNPWYPAESHDALRESFTADRDPALYLPLRAEDEDANPSIFGSPRLRDTVWNLTLSNHLPVEIANAPGAVLRLYVEGIGWRKLVRDGDGRRQMDEGSLRVRISDALETPSREIHVLGGGGTLYRERFAFWTDEEDLILFRGEAGRRVRDLARFTPEAGCPYAVVARSDVQLRAASGNIDCSERGEDWCLYRFSQGLPPEFAATVEGHPLWSPNAAPPACPMLQGASLGVHEVSATRLQLRAHLPAGWKAERFRFGGTRFTGGDGTLEISPAFEYAGKLAHAVVSRGSERHAVELRADKVGTIATGAAFQNADGRWCELRSDAPLDVGRIEGRTLATRWDAHRADDPWLTLGHHPLRSAPHTARLQRLMAMGEPLQLRFGLMNEDRAARVTIAPAVYSTGLLSEVRVAEDLYQLGLREHVELADELRIWVWEQGCTTPRLLPVDEVQAHDGQTLSILRLSAPRPIGWALALDGRWRGARFHAEACSENWAYISTAWLDVIVNSNNWQELAAVLRWWRFPALMEPFCDTIQEQASQHPFQTLRAWTEPLMSPQMALTPTEEPYISPLGSFLWNYMAGESECAELWRIHECELRQYAGKVSPTTDLLLRSHPILLARIVCEMLWSKENEEERQIHVATAHSQFLKRKQRSLAAMHSLEGKYRQFFEIAIDFVQQHAAYGGNSNGSSERNPLRAAALTELRSWTDPKPLDDRYFDQNIVRPAEQLFEQEACDTSHLQVAVARSPACCAYLVCHLLRIKGIKDRV
jgi:hypothetical protein